MTNTAIPEWSFGDRLRKARKSAGFSQEDLAGRIGVALSSYGTWEAERATPRGTVLVDVARKVSDETGVPAEWLLGLGISSFPDDPSPLDTPIPIPA